MTPQQVEAMTTTSAVPAITSSTCSSGDWVSGSVVTASLQVGQPRLAQPRRPLGECLVDAGGRLLERGDVHVVDDRDAGGLELVQVVLLAGQREAGHLLARLGALLQQDLLDVLG